jgi:AhpD family alkylhydroperoxidase
VNPAQQILDELRQPACYLSERIPGVLDSYRAFSTGVLADGALNANRKELIALAIAIANQGDGCIAAHGHGTAGRGLTGVEVAEASGVAITMSGGPGTVHAPQAFPAFDQFATEP